MIEFAITGDSELAAAIRGLPSKLAHEAAFAAVVAAVQPTVMAAKAYAPVDTGALRDSIGFRVRRYRRTHFCWGVVGAKRGFGTNGREPANYAHLVEFGHRTAQGGKLARVDGRRVKRGLFESAGRHTGDVPAQPFLRPAWDATKEQVLQILAREFGTRLEAEVRRRQASRPRVRRRAA